jgi:hypothetical protein
MATAYVIPKLELLFDKINYVLEDPKNRMLGSNIGWIAAGLSQLLHEGYLETYKPFKVQDTMCTKTVTGRLVTMDQYETGCKIASSPEAEETLALPIAMHLLRSKFKWEKRHAEKTKASFLTADWRLSVSSEYGFTRLTFSQLKFV